MNPTRLVAEREISTRVRTKSFVWTTIIMSALIAVAAFLPQIIGSFQNPTGIGASASAAQVLSGLEGDDYHIETVTTADAARQQILAGDLAAAVVDDADRPGRFTLLTGDLDEAAQQTITQLLQTAAQAQILAQSGVDIGQLQQAVEQAVTFEAVADDAQQQQIDPVALLISLVIVMLLFMQVFGSGLTVAQGVVEEKASRIVEVLLATVSPRQLLVGKVLGIGVIGLVQLVIFLVVGVGASVASGLLELNGQTIGIAAVSIAWFLPGYLFYAFAYAAAGSLVSRQEDIGQTTSVLTVLSLASLYAGVFGAQNLTADWVRILSVIPPFSAMLMPIRIATGTAPVVEIITAAVALVALVVLTALLGSRIYRRSVLLTGSRVSLRQALRGA